MSIKVSYPFARKVNVPCCYWQYKDGKVLVCQPISFNEDALFGFVDNADGTMEVYGSITEMSYAEFKDRVKGINKLLALEFKGKQVLWLDLINVACELADSQEEVV